MNTIMLLICIVCVMLSGCAVAQLAPSLRYCDKISYERNGREINITAHCFEAVDPAFPVPMPK